MKAPFIRGRYRKGYRYFTKRQLRRIIDEVSCQVKVPLPIIDYNYNTVIDYFKSLGYEKKNVVVNPPNYRDPYYHIPRWFHIDEVTEAV